MGKKAVSQDSPEVYVGVDPGASGGMAVLVGPSLLSVFGLPTSDQEVWDLFKDLKREYPNCFVCVEQVGGYQKGNPAPGSAMFNFGMAYMSVRMALLGNELRREYVHPAKWQKGLNVPPRGKKTKADHKRLLRQRATELYPGYKITLKTCDAVLLATYIQRKRTGTL